MLAMRLQSDGVQSPESRRFGFLRWDAEYFTGDKTEGETFIAMMIIAFITGMKLAGSDFVVKLSGLFFVVSLLPSTYFMIYGSTVKLEPAEWVVTDTSDDVGGYKPATLFSWVTWLYCGFNSLGSLAGEVKDPGRTYPIVVLTLIPAVIVLYVWPIAVAVSLDPNRTRYVPGHFTAVAVELSGEWLGNCFLAGAAVCFIGNYNADIIVCERSVAAFAEPYTVAYLNHKRRGVVTRYLLTENGTGVAPVYIVMNAALAAVLVWLPCKPSPCLPIAPPPPSPPSPLSLTTSNPMPSPPRAHLHHVATIDHCSR